ncbi:MAG: MauE/DoxX family redox-associated membrane protein [Pseudomonadota bacterium]
MIVQVGLILVAGVLLVSGWHKVRHPSYYQPVMSDYLLVVKSVPLILPGLLGVFELVVALSLFVPPLSAYGALAACMLFILYAGLISIQLIKGNREMDCGCTGPAAAKTKISPWLLLRSSVLIVFALMGAMMPLAESYPTGWLLSVLCGGFLLVIYYVAEQLLANAQSIALGEEGL